MYSVNYTLLVVSKLVNITNHTMDGIIMKNFNNGFLIDLVLGCVMLICFYFFLLYGFGFKSL